MDEHGFSGTDEWVANDRNGPGGAQRRRIARKDMAALLVAFNSSVSGWLALSGVPDACSLQAPRVLCTLSQALFSIARRSRRLEELFRVTQERADQSMLTFINQIQSKARAWTQIQRDGTAAGMAAYPTKMVATGGAGATKLGRGFRSV